MKRLKFLLLAMPFAIYGETMRQINNRITADDLRGALDHVQDVTGVNRVSIMQSIVRKWNPTVSPELERDLSDRADASLSSSEAGKIKLLISQKAAAAPRAVAPAAPNRAAQQVAAPAPIAQPVVVVQPAPAQPSAAVPAAPPLAPPLAPGIVPSAPANVPVFAAPSGPQGGVVQPQLRSVLPTRAGQPIEEYYHQAIEKLDTAIKAGNYDTAKSIVQRLAIQIAADEKELGTKENGQVAEALKERGLYPLASLKASLGNGMPRTPTEIQNYYLDTVIPLFDQAVHDNNVDQASTMLANVVIQLIKDAKTFVLSEDKLGGLIKQLRDRGLYPLTELYNTIQCVKEAKRAGTTIAACVQKRAAMPIARPEEPLKPKPQAPDQFALDAEKLMHDGNFQGALKSISAARIGSRKMLLLQILEKWDTAKNTITSKDIDDAAENLSTFDKQQVRDSMNAVESDPNAASAFALIGEGKYGEAFLLVESVKNESKAPIFLRIMDMWHNKTNPADGARLPAPIVIKGTPYTKIDRPGLRARAGQLLTPADFTLVDKVLEGIKKSE